MLQKIDFDESKIKSMTKDTHTQTHTLVRCKLACQRPTQRDDGQTLLYVDRHLLHEVTSPQAYEGLKLAGRKPWRVQSVVATADHNTST